MKEHISLIPEADDLDIRDIYTLWEIYKANKNNEISPSVRQLGKLTFCSSTETVVARLRKLAKLGLIEPVKLYNREKRITRKGVEFLRSNGYEI